MARGRAFDALLCTGVEMSLSPGIKVVLVSAKLFWPGVLQVLSVRGFRSDHSYDSNHRKMENEEATIRKKRFNRSRRKKKS